MTSTMWSHGRRVPGVTTDTAGYWTGGAAGELRIQYCSACDHWQHPPSPVCRLCRSGAAAAPRAVSGHGRVASWTCNEQSWYPGQPVPFRVGYVELVEQSGLYVFGGLIGGGNADDLTGMPVVTRFQQQSDVWLPVFEIADEGPVR